MHAHVQLHCAIVHTQTPAEPSLAATTAEQPSSATHAASPLTCGQGQPTQAAGADEHENACGTAMQTRKGSLSVCRCPGGTRQPPTDIACKFELSDNSSIAWRAQQARCVDKRQAAARGMCAACVRAGDGSTRARGNSIQQRQVVNSHAAAQPGVG